MTYKMAADITLWVVVLLVARFMVRIIARQRELHKRAKLASLQLK